MTRKRFVKQLMSRGINCNQAGEIAQRHSQNRAYADFNDIDWLVICAAYFGVSANKATKSLKRYCRIWKEVLDNA